SLVLTAAGAPDADCDELRARGFDRRAGFHKILVLPRADQQARRVRLARDEERVVHQPPPTATTISSWSPSATSVRACALFGTISPFLSTATFLPVISSRASNEATSSGASNRRAVPLIRTSIIGRMIPREAV